MTEQDNSSVQLPITDQPTASAVDQDTNKADSKISFGLGSFSLPTPESARQGFKLFLLISSLIVLTVQGIPQLPEVVKNYVLEFNTLAVVIANKIEDFYGIKVQ